ncbi:hypothetical protein M422DRAFT_29566 [Sphaerobolus stellatus SS14]|uniref:Glutamate decarboxylase n=1 Tax=Sphaerobolus stellatus (strain SS14) TaxID=990650 RepID=A0A0C9W2T4_SPHS4|nr:hypothetical protein M422DRAFT_29566 [Sphaerobolus stellatus SS14]
MDSNVLDDTRQKIINLASERDRNLHVLPIVAGWENAQKAVAAIPSALPEKGFGPVKAIDAILQDVVPGLALGQAGPRYFGFITGGTLPSAQLADFITTIYDQNAAPNRTEESITAVIENRTLEFVLDLLRIPKDKFPARVVTSGATASNVMGMAVARDYAIQQTLKTNANSPYSVSEYGFGGVVVKVYTDRPHSSLLKAAAITGIGRSNVIDLGKPIKREGDDNADSGTFGIDLAELEKYLKEAAESSATSGVRTAAIVVLSFGEVNTGDFTPNVREIRELCDKYNVWLHIDAAFGAYARLVPDVVGNVADGLELADSITSDAHKWFNVPYDCGLFFTRSVEHQRTVFGPSLVGGVPAYLAKDPSTSGVAISSEMRAALALPDPFYLTIENSRRFRALPLYAALLDQGREGYAELIRRNILFARRVAEWMTSPAGKGYYEVLNLREPLVRNASSSSNSPTTPLNIVFFRAAEANPVKAYQGPHGGAALIKAINGTNKMQVTPGPIGGVRLAVSNWSTGLYTEKATDGTEKGDFEIVVETLLKVVEDPPELVA